MKKFVVVVAVAVLMAFAAPVLAATNPFMDVPMNHWAYDAIGQLAAHGILSGYPDGLYRGKQPTTRYEMASALARALAVVDMTKASKQDVEMLKKLVTEFKDELEALGVKVDALDKRVAVLESRLGGWKISGVLRQDITNQDKDAPASDSASQFGRARLFLDRWFGEDEGMHFQVRLDDDNNDGVVGLSRFFAEIPFYWDSKLTVGRFLWDKEADYYLGGTSSVFGFMNSGHDSVLTDRTVNGFGWSKDFGVGNVEFYVGHPKLSGLVDSGAYDGYGSAVAEDWADYGVWEIFGMGKFQFSERFGFDLGFQAILGDNNEFVDPTLLDPVKGFKFNSLYTLFAGLRFDFNENIAFKGIYYYQDVDAELWDGAVWFDQVAGNDLFDNTKAFKLILDVKQDALKFTSLWLEYSNYDQNFIIPTGTASLFHEELYNNNKVVPYDLSVWRIAGEQKWNDKWTTYFYVAGYKFEDGASWTDLGGRAYLDDAKALQWALGVRYYYNPNVSFGLSYSDLNWKSEAENAGYRDDHVLRFRTQVTF